MAVLFLNADTNKTQDLSVSLAGLGLTGGLSVRDVWEKSDAGQTSTSAGNFTSHAIPPQDSKLLLFKPSKEALETQLEPGRFSFAPLSRLASKTDDASSAAKGPCEDYFGKGVGSNSTEGLLWTVADTDVHAGFPFGNETFIHHSGPDSLCISPGPPAGCHRYYVASYAADRCTEECRLLGGRAERLAGTIDAAGAFDRGSGVLNGCMGCLTAVKISCWGAPADAPRPCPCPGTSV